jgi:dTDP-4-amino-4,6-dideoxygalactose transaminase
MNRSAVFQPKGPVMSGAAWRGPRRLPGLATLLDRRPRRLTSSGRGAIHAALRALALPVGSRVAVPSYHCPTLVAPAVALGLVPVFYPLAEDGSPRLDVLADLHRGAGLAVLLVAQWFGQGRSLAAERAWCDARGVVLVEDCAHTLAGRAGERAVGAWGHYATASLTKFLPVAEAGLLVAEPGRVLPPLRTAPIRPQLKAVIDVVDRALAAGRLPALRRWRPAAAMPTTTSAPGTADAPSTPPAARWTAAEALRSCDMARVEQAAPLVTRLAVALLPLGASLQRRRAHAITLARGLADLPGTRLLGADPGDAPYVLPWCFDDADRADAVYAEARAAGLAVFRWDIAWPGAPGDEHAAQDHGVRWRRRVLQLLCHQDLADTDLQCTLDILRRAWARTSAPAR